MDEIINKVANSSLQVFDLEDYYIAGIRTQIDLAPWLFEGFILKEKEFRETLKNQNWEQYQDHFIAIYCSTDAILPAWAMALVAVQVAPFAKKVITGSIEDIETILYTEILSTIEFK